MPLTLLITRVSMSKNMEMKVEDNIDTTKSL